MKEMLGIIYAYPFYGLGWLTGTIIKVARLTWASLQEGFEAGRQL